jgi:cytochrome c-type biogenesis protein CcmH/NrfG
VEQDPRAALPLLEAHVRARPSDASGHGNYGVALAAAGRGAEATSHLERALAQGGDPRRWYDALRKLDATRALDGLDRRARAEAENDRTWALLGKELRAAGRAAEARAAYEQAARLDPTNRDWARALRDLK